MYFKMNFRSVGLKPLSLIMCPISRNFYHICALKPVGNGD